MAQKWHWPDRRITSKCAHPHMSGQRQIPMPCLSPTNVLFSLPAAATNKNYSYFEEQNYDAIHTTVLSRWSQPVKQIYPPLMKYLATIWLFKNGKVGSKILIDLNSCKTKWRRKTKTAFVYNLQLWFACWFIRYLWLVIVALGACCYWLLVFEGWLVSKNCSFCGCVCVSACFCIIWFGYQSNSMKFTFVV